MSRRRNILCHFHVQNGTDHVQNGTDHVQNGTDRQLKRPQGRLKVKSEKSAFKKLRFLNSIIVYRNIRKISSCC